MRVPSSPWVICGFPSRDSAAVSPTLLWHGSEDAAKAPTDSPADTRAAIARVAIRAAGAVDPDTLGDLAVSRFIGGDTDDAVRLLEDAVVLGPCDARLLNNLAAIYLARAATASHPSNPSAAIDAATRANACGGPTREASFNLALALDAAGLHTLASDAWTTYLKADPTGAWADKARTHLASPRQRQAVLGKPGSACSRRSRTCI